jgi:Hemerythrin HHE cation binding domain
VRLQAEAYLETAARLLQLAAQRCPWSADLTSPEDQVSANEDRREADKYAEGDLLGVLYRQHAEITEALERVAGSKGDERSSNFAAAVDFMSRHEAAERKVVRPIVEGANEPAEAKARNEEESQADKAIAELTALDVDGDDFETKFKAFAKAVADHAETEETDEFPIVLKARSEEQRIELGAQFLEVRA